MQRVFFFFFNDTATTEIYTLSLHDALPIFIPTLLGGSRTVMTGNLIQQQFLQARDWAFGSALSVMLAVLLLGAIMYYRSEEHTSELQSRQYLVCRLLLEKKKRAVGSGPPVG